MKIKRYYLDRISSMLQPGRVLAIYGARRSGKTTLIEDFLKTWTDGRYFLGTGEDRAVKEVLGSSDVNLLSACQRDRRAADRQTAHCHAISNCRNGA